MTVREGSVIGKVVTVISIHVMLSSCTYQLKGRFGVRKKGKRSVFLLG